MTLTQLLTFPDPPEMLGVWGRPRGHRVTIGGRLNKDAIKLALAVAYVTWRWQEHTDGDISGILWVAKSATLRL